MNKRKLPLREDVYWLRESMYCGLKLGITDFTIQGTCASVPVNLAIDSFIMITKETFKLSCNTSFLLLDDFLRLRLAASHDLIIAR